MELFRLFGTIAVNNTEANNAIRDTTEEANNSSNEISDAFTAIGGVASKIASAIGIAGLAISGAFIATIESTREYRKEMGLLESAFLTAGHSSDVAKSTYSDLNAVMGDSGAAVEAAQHLSLVADNEAELNEMTHTLTGVYATFGSSLPLEGIAEAINHSSALGETQGSLADALEWSGITVDDFNVQLAECTTEEERQDLIMRTLKDTYSKAADQYKETNKDVIAAEKANERLADAFAEVGRIGEPILTVIKNKIAELMEVAIPKIQAFIDKIKDATQWVKDNEQTIQTWVGIIIGATASVGTFLLILNWGAIMTAASKAVGTVRTAILAMNAAMMANPIGLIVALIVGLVATFIYLWNNVDGFKKFWIDAWNLIQKKASEAKEWIEKAWSKIGEWFSERFAKVKQAGKDAMDNVKKFFSDGWNRITSIFGSVGSWFGEKFRNAWSNIKNAFSNWGSFFSELWGKVKNKFGDIGTKVGDAIGNAVKKAMNSALSKIEGGINKGIKLINSAIKFAGKLGFDVSTVAEVKLPRLAKGTVVDEATPAIIGEDGAEAVVPLERNTGWIDMLAMNIESRLGGVTNKIMVDRMNDIIRLIKELLDRNIYLDTGALVGELSPAIDTRLGDRYKHAKRGNTR